MAVLRQASGIYTAQPDSTAVSLSYGPHGGGHGHSDNMNIVLYAQGRQWIPAFGSMPYETQAKNDWTAEPSATTPWWSMASRSIRRKSATSSGRTMTRRTA